METVKRDGRGWSVRRRIGWALGRSAAATMLGVSLLSAPLAHRAVGQTVSEAPPLAEVEGLKSLPPSSTGVQTLLTNIVRSQIPIDYQRDKDWGMTKEVTRGLRIRQEGLRITTKRRRKTVNHGTWKKYSIRLINPQESFRIRVENYVEQPNHRVAFDLVVDAKLDAIGRLSHWERGLQLISIGASAYSEVTLRVRCDVGLLLDPTHIPPDIVLDPKVVDANIEIKEFRLRELSDLKGPFAKVLSSSVREILEDAIASKRTRMVQKMNDKIDRSRDKLRLSFSEMLKSPWADKIQTAKPAANRAEGGPAESD